MKRPSPAASRHALPASGARDLAREMALSEAKGRMRGFDRRTFCKLLGGGIVVLITSKPPPRSLQKRRRSTAVAIPGVARDSGADFIRALIGHLQPWTHPRSRR